MRAFVAAGAKGLVSAGFAPGIATAADLAAMADAVAQGITVVQSLARRLGRASTAAQKLADAGILAADNLNPQKARMLLALALTVTVGPGGDRADLRELLTRPASGARLLVPSQPIRNAAVLPRRPGVTSSLAGIGRAIRRHG